MPDIRFVKKINYSKHFTGKRFRKCGRKHRFVSREEAKFYMYKQGTKFKTIKNMNAYKCNFCGFWHIGGVDNMIEFGKRK